GAPNFSGVGFAVGSATSYVYSSYSNNFQVKEGFSLIRGRHNLKFGFEGTARRFIYYNGANDKGIFQFASSAAFTGACPQGNRTCDQARQSAGLTTGGFEFASFLLGAFTSDNLILSQIPYVGHQTYAGAYIRDSWRATNRLTVNLGLRYEYFSPWTVPSNT